MGANRLAKVVARGLRVTWRDEPTQHEIEALDANIRRVGLVIRLRWILVLALTLYSMAATGLYTQAIPLEELVSNLIVPSLALLFVLVYNAYYQMTYRRLGNIAVLNHLQLAFDILVVGVLVHYSGGVYSWFHAMFLLFILEGAFILPRGRDTWYIAGVAAAVYIAVVTGQYYHWLPRVSVPFVANDLHAEPVFVWVRSLWVLTMIAGTASISSRMMSDVRDREHRLEESVIVDEGTGLCNRHFFLRQLKAELRRARKSDGPVGVIVLDVDDFTRFNETFGYTAGNRIIKALADEMADVVSQGADADADLVTLCRWGGEEFALVVPGEPPATDADNGFHRRVSRLAENLRTHIEGVRLEDKGVTVSVGVATYPSDGSTVDDLMDAVDQAVMAACQAGGDRVVMASDLEPQES